MGWFGGKQSKSSKRPNERTKTASQAQADELRVRARRRLLGAVVLVLVAVLVVPLLFEDTESTDYAQPPEVVVLEPPERPDTDLALELSEPVDDDDLFMAGHDTDASSLTMEDDPASDTAQPEGSPVPDASTEEETDATPAEADQADAPSSTPDKPPADERTDDGSLALALLEGREPESATDAGEQQAAAGQYIVQIAAYGAREDAEKRRSRLAESGVTNAYIEAASGSNNTAWRLRVGPFSTRDAAQAAQTRLRTLGYDNSLLLTQ